MRQDLRSAVQASHSQTALDSLLLELRKRRRRVYNIPGTEKPPYHVELTVAKVGGAQLPGLGPFHSNMSVDLEFHRECVRRMSGVTYGAGYG